MHSFCPLLGGVGAPIGPADPELAGFSLSLIVASGLPTFPFETGVAWLWASFPLLFVPLQL